MNHSRPQPGKVPRLGTPFLEHKGAGEEGTAGLGSGFLSDPHF